MWGKSFSFFILGLFKEISIEAGPKKGIRNKKIDAKPQMGSIENRSDQNLLIQWFGSHKFCNCNMEFIQCVPINSDLIADWWITIVSS